MLVARQGCRHAALRVSAFFTAPLSAVACGPIEREQPRCHYCSRHEAHEDLRVLVPPDRAVGMLPAGTDLDGKI
jgi:hypothetical protein